MRLIVLAAGRGTRMGRLTSSLPKPLVPLLDGTTLLERNIRAMESVHPIDEMLLVSGHAAEMLDAASLRLKIRKPIRVQYNPFYRVSGPLVSVWLARGLMNKMDFLLCNGDTVYGANALRRLAKCSPGHIVLGIDKRTRRSADDMRVQLDPKRNLLRVGKDIPDGCAQGISTGLLVVRGSDMRRAFVEQVCDMIREPENLRPRMAWHSILNVLVGKGTSVSIKRLDGGDWHEVDTSEDLRSIRFPSVRLGRPRVRRKSSHRQGRQTAKAERRKRT